MNLKEKIHHQFQHLQSRSNPGCAHLTVEANGGHLECEVLAVDELACALQEISYTTDKLAHASLEQLKQLSQSLSAQLRYLLEPIGLIETDPEQCLVQLRSQPPSKEEPGTSYYELLVRRGGQLTLCRYIKTPGQPRQSVPINLTREVFQRLAHDLVNAVSP